MHEKNCSDRIEDNRCNEEKLRKNLDKINEDIENNDIRIENLERYENKRIREQDISITEGTSMPYMTDTDFERRKWLSEAKDKRDKLSKKKQKIEEELSEC